MAARPRRQSIRRQADLLVHYRTGRAAPWRRCRIVDLSEHGAAVELYDLDPGESLTGKLEMEVSSVEPDAAGVVLRAQIRHRKQLAGGLLVGVEFTPTSADYVNLLRLLIELHALPSDT